MVSRKLRKPNFFFINNDKLINVKSAISKELIDNFLSEIYFEIKKGRHSYFYLCITIIRLFRIIPIPSKFCYFRPPDHVISMELLALNFRCQCTQQKLPIDMCRFNVRSST